MYPKLLLHSSGTMETLARQPLASAERDEAWLRDLLLQHPEALPAAEVDPTFAEPIPVCRELRTAAGPVDAVFVNRHGALTIVECKLWRNPQARRDVVGQILDYAKELARWRYEDFQRRLSRVRPESSNVLYSIVAERHPDVVEATFVDAVSRNLRHGRFLLLVAGDGIRDGTEAIVEFLERHAGLSFKFGLVLSFKFGLVEMAGYSLPDGRLLVQPRVLARSVELERTVFRFQRDLAEDDGLSAQEPERTEAAMRSSGSDPAAVTANAAFWQEVVAVLASSDSVQREPQRRGPTFVSFEVGIPGTSLMPFRERSKGRIGVRATFRGDAGRQFLDSLAHDEIAEVEDMLRAAGGPNAVLSWEPHNDDMRLYVRLAEAFEPPAEADARHKAWLGQVSNAFINVLRPRIAG